MKTPLKAGEIFKMTVVFFVAIIIGLIISSELFTIADVNNISMQNTLIAGDKLYINKFAYRFSSPARGDIIVFLEGETTNGFLKKLKITVTDITRKVNGNIRKNRLVKRVIGLPGDTIELKNGDVYINSIKLKESYIKGMTYSYKMTGLSVVPEGTVFVMGDNREHSKDSRIFGFVKIDSIEGRVVFRLWPINKISLFN